MKTDNQKKEKALIRKTLSKLNKVYAPFRKKFGVKLGLRLNESYAEIYCIDPDKKEIVFGADVKLQKKTNWEDINNKDVVITLNHGSLGSYDPNDNNNGAALGHLIATTITKWERVEPILKDAFQEYEETFPRARY